MSDDDRAFINGHFTAYEFLLEVTLAQTWACWPEGDVRRVREELLERVRFGAYSSDSPAQDQDAVQVQAVCIAVTERVLEKVAKRADGMRQSARVPSPRQEE